MGQSSIIRKLNVSSFVTQFTEEAGDAADEDELADRGD